MILTTIYGVVTFALIIAFIALCIWAYSPSRRQRFTQDANIPFMDDMNHTGFARRNS